MLILSRYQGQAIRIGPDVTVVVTAIKQANGCRPMVKLGIDAPQSITVIREEIEERYGAPNDSDQRCREASGGEAGTGARPCVPASPSSESHAHVRGGCPRPEQGV